MKTFLQHNLKILTGMIIGLAIGFIHWYLWGYTWGTYPMSSECWFNCIIGSLFGGFIICLIDENISKKYTKKT